MNISEELYFEEKIINNTTILKMHGSVNFFNFSEFKDKLYFLLENSDVCLDMHDIIGFASAGAGVLMAALEVSHTHKHTLYILNPSRIVIMTIKATGFYSHFKVISSLKEITERRNFND